MQGLLLSTGGLIRTDHVKISSIYHKLAHILLETILFHELCGFHVSRPFDQTDVIEISFTTACHQKIIIKVHRKFLATSHSLRSLGHLEGTWIDSRVIYTSFKAVSTLS